MPSKKKARGKARRAAKSRKAGEDAAAAADEKNDIDSQMQRLKINYDEDALLANVINLAATGNSKICPHGFIPLPSEDGHVCEAFIDSLGDGFRACCEKSMGMTECFKNVYYTTERKHAEVWNDPGKLQSVISYFLARGTDHILEGDYKNPLAIYVSFLEQWVAIEHTTQAKCNWGKFLALCNWSQIGELPGADNHTLVSFFKKRIPCNCLEKRHKEVKSITKIGICHNLSCSLPDRKASRSKMLYCTQCRIANYCSRECQVADWPEHKNYCSDHKLTAQKLMQKK